jgi:hypothetical protein
MKRLAFVFGVVFALLGIAGLVPALCPGGRLFGILATNEAHTLFHLATGVLGVAMSFTRGFARKYFRIVGVVYGLVAVMGFLEGGHGMLLGMAMNWPDNVLDLAVAVVALVLGFLGADAAVERKPASA